MKLNQYQKILFFISLLLILGILFGVILPLLLPYDQKEEVTRRLLQFFHNLSIDESLTSYENFLHKSLQYLLISLLIFLLGISVIGVPIVLGIVFMKGTMIGFTTGFIISELKGKGILFILISIIPQNLLIIPSLVILSASSLSFAFFIIRNRIQKYHGKIKPYFLSYLMIYLGFSSILIITAIYESYLAPLVLEKSIALLFP